MCYRVDLRLRPDGKLGEVCISLDGAKAYYRSRARTGTANADQGAGGGGRACPRPRSAGACRAFDLFDDNRFRSGRIGIGHAGAHPRKTAGAQRAGESRRQTGAGGNPRRRVPGAVPAKAARRARSLGAPWRHVARPIPAARQGLSFADGVCAPGLRVSVPPQSRAPSPVRRRPADAHASGQSGRTGNCWRGECRRRNWEVPPPPKACSRS